MAAESDATTIDAYPTLVPARKKHDSSFVSTERGALENPAQVRPLPAPLAMGWQVFGPTAVFTALAIGSGELVFWPSLTLANGPGVLWIALLALAVQYVIDVEIGRYSLATGESAVVGASRLWRGWGWILLAATVLPWLWPGWARAGCQLLGSYVGLPEKPLSVVSLLLCGLLLAAPKRVYAVVEKVQSALLAFILAGVAVLFLIAADSTAGIVTFWSRFFSGEGLEALAAKVSSSRSTEFLALLGGIVFAGAGGVLNLGYGLLLCEKRFGMGAYSSSIVGLRHSIGLSRSSDGPALLGDDLDTRSRWAGWLDLCRKEHALLFLGGNTFTILFLSLTFACLFGGFGSTGGPGFLTAAADRFAGAAGSAASVLFLAVAFVIFFTSEIGILDVTSRLAAGILANLSGARHISPSALYHGVVWTEVLVGIALTVLDPRQPFWFLVTSAVLNTLAMAVYSALLLVLNATRLPRLARPGPVTMAILAAASASYAALFAVTVWRL